MKVPPEVKAQAAEHWPNDTAPKLTTRVENPDDFLEVKTAALATGAELEIDFCLWDDFVTIRLGEAEMLGMLIAGEEFVEFVLQEILSQKGKL